MTDDKTRQLENRIDELEETIQKMMPSRRDALKMGGAALVGGAAMSGTASAGTNQVGTIGSASQPVDLESEDINNADTITTQDIDVSQNVNGADTSAASNGEALTSDGSGGLAFATVGGGIPANFTYQDKTSQRSLDTVFTNNTGKALYVTCHARSTFDTDFKVLTVVVDGVKIQKHIPRLASGTLDQFHTINAEFFVPDGSSYEVRGTNLDDLAAWFEAEM